MLFSEPKIPQCRCEQRARPQTTCFSALQRAENSSIHADNSPRVSQACFSALQRAENSSIGLRSCTLRPFARFQCSSASRKFLNLVVYRNEARLSRFQCSSASRKFLNFERTLQRADRSRFQCSSASRKFLNQRLMPPFRAQRRGFSALQRAENSSIVVQRPVVARGGSFSALQRAENSSIAWSCSSTGSANSGFSALQRAENSSIAT